MYNGNSYEGDTVSWNPTPEQYAKYEKLEKKHAMSNLSLLVRKMDCSKAHLLHNNSLHSMATCSKVFGL